MTARRPVLVGELNPYRHESRFALYCLPQNSAGGRLQQMILNIARRDYLELPRHNLCTLSWNMDKARRHAREIVNSYSNAEAAFVLLGRKVARAFSDITGELPAFTAMEEQGKLFIALPHPSGRCRAWNERGEPTPYEQARALIKDACPEWAERVKL